ncbi:hypothetical protein L9F63_000832, partial [Diploptera punctata]
DNVKSGSPTQLIQDNKSPSSPDRTLIAVIKVDLEALATVDFFVSTLLVSPLVIGQWRGTWMLSEYYKVPCWASFLLGTILHLIFALFKDLLQELFSKKEKKFFSLKPVLLFVCCRVYTWVFGIACISHWKGAWEIMDKCAGKGVWSVVAVTLTSVGLLSLMKTLRNINASPFNINVDGLSPGFTFPTMFRTSV